MANRWTPAVARKISPRNTARAPPRYVPSSRVHLCGRGVRCLPLIAPPSSLAPKDHKREGSFTGSFVLLISSLITARYSRGGHGLPSSSSPPPGPWTWTRCVTSSHANKQPPCGRTSGAVDLLGGEFWRVWIGCSCLLRAKGSLAHET